jgi:FMN phosphatase YigB (HAD superfamily)
MSPKYGNNRKKCVYFDNDPYARKLTADPRIFHACLKELDLQPEETVFLDDLGGNLKSARQLGIRTIKVQNVY